MVYIVTSRTAWLHSESLSLKTKKGLMRKESDRELSRFNGRKKQELAHICSGSQISQFIYKR